MLKRFFDIIASLIGILVLLPFFILVALAIFLNTGLPVFYLQSRVGRNNKDFKLFKFRTMYKDAEKKGLLTVGGRDERITPIGYYLRKYKIDELPQLFNVLFGSMSLVGPRPEVRKYVNLYTETQLFILSVKPGITDPASLHFINENDLLAKASDPEHLYTTVIMPQKLELNKKYIMDQGFSTDISIILATIKKIVS